MNTVIEKEQPLHLRIRDRIIEEIASGKIRPDDRGVLPSQIWLSEHMGVGLTTIKHAVKELVESGVVESRRRKGLILKNNPADNPAAGILHFGIAFFQGFEHIKHTRTSSILMGIEDYAREANIALHISSFPGLQVEMELADALFSTYEAYNIDGMLLLSAVSPRSFVRLRDNGIPFVMTGYYSEEWAVCHAPDATKAAFLITNSLLLRGKRNIVLFSGNLNLINSYLQISGYSCALESHGVQFRQDYVSGQTYDYDAAAAFVQGLLDEGKEVDAVMAFDDVMGAHIARYLQSIGRGDIAIAGTSNYEEYADLISVTVDYSFRQIGYNATKMLAEMAKGKTPKQTKHYYDVKLIERY